MTPAHSPTRSDRTSPTYHWPRRPGPAAASSSAASARPTGSRRSASAATSRWREERRPDMEISVIVVTLGRTPLLERCVRAVASGTLRPRELVVVDQGPPGLGPRLEEWLAGSAVALEHLDVPPMGVSPARNIGAVAAAAGHLAFTDDDC